MQIVENFNINSIPVWKILFVVTSEPDYSMDRIYLVEDYDDNSNYLVIIGGHCSCYDFNETQWFATIYNREELLKVAEGWKKSGWGFEKIMADFIVSYLTR